MINDLTKKSIIVKNKKNIAFKEYDDLMSKINI